MLHDTVKTLLKVQENCDLYIQKKIPVSQLHAVIEWAEASLTSVEDNKLRDFFRKMESALDFERVMNNSTDFMYEKDYEEIENREKILEIVHAILKKCEKILKDVTSFPD